MAATACRFGISSGRRVIPIFLIREAMARGAAVTGQTILSISGHYHPGVAPIESDGVSYLVGRAFCEAPYGYAIITLEGRAFRVEQYDLVG